MNYKETLFFIGKCLTITHEKHNKVLVEDELKLKKVNWDNVVKLSTAHYVFPLLYYNLKHADLLHYLPNDLVEYMKHITDLNHQRNLQVISQAKEINKLLLANNIEAVFLKGTGNLLDKLYDNIAERMVGDIDILVSYANFEKTIKILKNNSYKTSDSQTSLAPDHRHYPRLAHNKYIAAIEVHKEVLRDDYGTHFNFNTLKSELKNSNKCYTVRDSNKLMITILNSQINDYGYFLKTFSLRSVYDVYLLSKKVNTLTVINDFSFFFQKTNSFLALSHMILHLPDSIKFKNDKKTKKYVLLSLKNLGNKKLFQKKTITIKKMSSLAFKAIYSSSHREFILSRIKAKLGF